MPDQLTLDPEILTPLAERVCIRACRMASFDLDDRRLSGPLALVGDRLTLADCSPTTASGILLKLAEGDRRGFFSVPLDDKLAFFGWFVRPPDTEPLVNVAELSIIPVPVNFGDDGDDIEDADDDRLAPTEVN